MSTESLDIFKHPNFGAGFVSELQNYYYRNLGYSSWGASVPAEIREMASGWINYADPLFRDVLDSLVDGPTSFMCHAGVQRSGILAEVATNIGLEVVEAVGGNWALPGRNIGLSYFWDNINRGLKFIRTIDSNGVYLGDNIKPSRNLVVCYDSLDEIQLADLDLFLSEIESTKYLRLRVIALDLCETAVEILAMPYINLQFLPSALAYRLRVEYDLGS